MLSIVALTINTTWSISQVLPQETESEIKIERIFVKKVLVQGSTVFTASELQQVISPFEGKSATLEELLAIRAAVTDLYVEKGYITSGAIVPPQDFINRVVRIKVIEGSLERIEIKGLTYLNENYVKDRLQRVARVPLNINDLEDGLKLLQLNPLFDPTFRTP